MARITLPPGRVFAALSDPLTSGVELLINVLKPAHGQERLKSTRKRLELSPQHLHRNISPVRETFDEIHCSHHTSKHSFFCETKELTNTSKIVSICFH